MNFPNTVAVTQDTAMKHCENDWTVSPSSGALGSCPLQLAGTVDVTDGRNIEGGNGGLHFGIDRVVVVT